MLNNIVLPVLDLIYPRFAVRVLIHDLCSTRNSFNKIEPLGPVPLPLVPLPVTADKILPIPVIFCIQGPIITLITELPTD
jgi:hypothetical protein